MMSSIADKFYTSFNGILLFEIIQPDWFLKKECLKLYKSYEPSLPLVHFHM